MPQIGNNVSLPEKVGLTQEEKDVLATLLRKALNTDIRGAVWHALVQIFPIVAVEMLVFNGKGEVFLAYRNDPEYGSCWHHPGSVWNDWERIEDRLQKLLDGELKQRAGIAVKNVRPIGWLAVYRGTGPNDDSSRNACTLMHVGELDGEYAQKEGFGFFPVDDLPDDILPCHRYMVGRVVEAMRTNTCLCG